MMMFVLMVHRQCSCYSERRPGLESQTLVELSQIPSNFFSFKQHKKIQPFLFLHFHSFCILEYILDLSGHLKMLVMSVGCVMLFLCFRPHC